MSKGGFDFGGLLTEGEVTAEAECKPRAAGVAELPH